MKTQQKRQPRNWDFILGWVFFIIEKNMAKKMENGVGFFFQ